MLKKRDHSLELLLDLDGLNFAQEGGFWIKYEVSAVEKTSERPHGIKYSLTLHDPQGKRIFGIDNAHRPRKRRGPAAKSTRPKAADHMHRDRREYIYEFDGAETLLVDFDKGVNAALKRQGIKI
jgi:hypothetical protein